MPQLLFTLGKSRYPLYRRLGGPQGRSGQVRKISPPLGFDLRTVQPVASHYTDYATRPVVTIKDKQEFSGLFCGVERQCNKSVEVNPPDMFLLLTLYGVNSNTGGGHCLDYTVPMSCLLQIFCFYLTLTQKCE